MYLLFRITISLWPASWWLDVDRVAVFDSVSGADVIMEVDRTIHRDFVADWSVVVRSHDSGGWKVWCTARGTSDYRPDAALPDPLTLEWWTDGKCTRPPPGQYLISTIWTVRGRGGLPDKLVQSLSNIFTVYSDGEFNPT
jgi:hypothetical protein